MSAFDEKNDVLFVKTRHGFIFKSIAELLSKTIKNACFVMNSKGLSLEGIDYDMNTLIIINLPKENFNNFICVPENICLGLNTSAFYKLLKSIKKKDLITMKVSNDNSSMLKLILEHPDEGHSIQTSIKFIKIQPNSIEQPNNYNNELLIGGKEFQKLIKSLGYVGKNIIIFTQKNGVRFYCDGGEMYNREVIYGSYDSNKPNVYEGTFNTTSISQLIKLSSLSTNIQLFTNPELPIKIKIQLGVLGIMDIYLKSQELIEFEKTIN